MTVKRWTMTGLMGTGLLGACLAISACGGAYVGYYANTPPPPVRYEAFGPAPGPGYVWINGYWGYRGNNYVWIPGRYERPPAGRRRWEDGRWEHRGNRYVYHEGRWR